MLVSYNLLKKYSNLPEDTEAQEVARKLTMSTVEVEGVIEKSKQLDKVYVGKIMKITKHPNADRLKLVDILIGEDKIERVVCGGVNLKKSMLVAFAGVGAKVRWHGEGEVVELTKTKIRGEESNGMICAADEIGLESLFESKDMEILDLSNLGLQVGEPLASALGFSDAIFDIDNKSLTNRPDLWGHYGMARELSAIYKVDFGRLELDSIAVKDKQLGGLTVTVEDSELCKRYLAVRVDNIEIKESPEWMRKILLSTGHSIFNSVVDITNYVMEEVGQPLHAFDSGVVDNIVVRKAKKGEKIITLDGETRDLEREMLVITDAKKPIAIAGIMGGLKSGITEKTNSIIIEAATFDALSIRKTSQKLGMRTDASMRFEKSLDSHLAETAIKRAVQLIKEIIPGAKVSEWAIEAGEVDEEVKDIEVSLDFICRRIGNKISEGEIVGILGRLGFDFKAKDGILKIKVPSWRATGDISIKEDIVEEVARIYGYDNLEDSSELVELEVAKRSLSFEIETKVKNYLFSGAGMRELFNYPWADEKILKSLGFEKDLIELSSPPAENLRFLQPTLLANLIKNIYDNLRYFEEFKLFELSRVFLNKQGEKWGSDKLPKQPNMVAGVVVAKSKQNAFLEIKGIVEGLFELLGLELVDYLGKYEFKKQGILNYLEFENGQEGMIAKLDGDYKGKKVAVFEINFDRLVETTEENKKYISMPQYPVVVRDIAIEVDWDIDWHDVKIEVLKQDNLIKQIEFLSEYPLKDKKSLAFRITYGDNKTLTDKEVEKVEKKIIDKLNKKFKAVLRR